MADQYEEKVRKGQAYNLAVAEAIHKEKTDDTQFIYERFIRYYELGGLLQRHTVDEIKEALK